MEYLIIWILFGAVAAIIAGTKERSGCGWFLLGCLFGPFSLVVALLPSLKSDPNAPSPETHIKCPDCAELVLNEARVCKHCGCKLVPVSEQPKQPTPQPFSFEGMRCNKDCKNAIIIVAVILGALWFTVKSVDSYKHYSQKSATQSSK